MNTARCMLALLVLQLGAPLAHSATRIDLNRGWEFRTEAGSDSAAGWSSAAPQGTKSVDLPHTWNRTGADYAYLGTGWYFQRFELPKLPATPTTRRSRMERRS
jgi:hypothetical protein